jgi:magnesium transporter
VIVDSALYRKGQRIEVDCLPHEFEKLRSEATEEGDFVWVGLYKPSQGELDDVAASFGLHPLAVEDALKAHQRPKLERYDDSLFLTIKTLWYVDADDQVETGEINLFAGHDFVITVRHGRGQELHSARARLESDTAVLTHGPSSVIYAVCDSVVDGYGEVIDELQTDVDEIESSVFSPARTNDSNRIYVLKREIAEVRRAVMPLRDPMRKFADGLVHGVEREAGPFFRDVLDHLNQAADVVDTLDSLLSTAFDAHLARITVQQNDDMRKISAGVALVAAPTLIAGIYGMNFEHMPELGWYVGYPLSVLLMFAISAALWIWFKKSGWL